MANTLTLFSKGGGYPKYTPIEPETFKISNTEFVFNMPRSYKDNTAEIKLNATPVTAEPFQLTPIAKPAAVQTKTTMAAATTTSPNLSVNSKKSQQSQQV